MQRMMRIFSPGPTYAILAAAFVSFFLNSPILGQSTPPSSTAPAGGTTVISNVDEVSLDVEAYDKKGNPVSDLKPSEVQIVDGRAPVQLRDLRLVAQSPVSDRRQRVILLFDQMEAGNAKSARDAALEILKDAPADVPFMVLRVDGRLRLLQMLTTDREALKTAVNAATIDSPAAYAAANRAAETAMQTDMKGGPNELAATAMMKMLLDSQNTAADPHMTPSVAGLLAVCRGEAGSGGRKTLIYFSQSLAWNVSAPESLRLIVTAANRARVTIDSIDAHPVDPQATSGMLATSALGTAAGAEHSGFAAASGPTGNVGAAGLSDQVTEQAGRFEAESGNLSKAPLESICASTGGVHEISGNARKSTRVIVGDLSSYYVASYSLPADAGQDRFRPVLVKSLRPGVVLMARSGYFVPPRVSRPAAAFEPRLVAALAATPLPQDLQFHAQVLRFGEAEAGTMNAVVLSAPLSDVDVREDSAASAWSAHLSFLVIVKDKSGNVVERFTDDQDKRGQLTAQDQARGQVVTIRRHFDAPPGNYTLEAAVLDVNSGKVAAQRSDLTIPPKAAGPGLSDIVVARRIDPFAGDEDVDRIDPLRCAEGRVVPNVSGHVSKATDPTLTLYFQLYPEHGSTTEPIMKAEVRRNGALIGTVPLSLGPSAGKAFVPYLAKLGTASLQPGAYTLTVIASQGDQSTKQSVSFTLE